MSQMTSIHILNAVSPRSLLILSFDLGLCLIILFPSDITTKITCSFLISHHLFYSRLFDHKLWSFSSYRFLQPIVTSILSNPNILLTTPLSNVSPEFLPWCEKPPRIDDYFHVELQSLVLYHSFPLSKDMEFVFFTPCNSAVSMFSFVFSLFAPPTALSCKQIIVIFKTHLLVSRRTRSRMDKRFSIFVRRLCYRELVHRSGVVFYVEHAFHEWGRWSVGWF